MKSPRWLRGSPRNMWRAAYVFAGLLLTAELLLPGRSLYRWDTLIYTWPLVLEARAQWLAGHVPFWASSVCCGTPLLPNINAGVLYPLHALAYLLPLPLGYHLFLAAHVWLSLAGMHLLLRRRLQLHPAAAFVGAVAYAASGYARGMWDTHNFLALPWIPLGLAALLGCTGGRLRMARGLLATAACWSMLLLGGDFQAACIWVPAAILLAALHPRRRALLPALGAALAVGGLLTAPQWLPTVTATAGSYRAAGLPYAEAVERSLHPIRLLEWFVPNLFGSRAGWFGPMLVNVGSGPQLPWTSSVHVGRIAFGLALLGCLRLRHPAARWALLLALGGTLLSFGGYLPGFSAWLSLPVVGTFRYPTKYMLWGVFGLCVLAAYGAQAWLALVRAARARRIVGIAVVWFAVLAGATAVGHWVLLGLSPHAPGVGPWAEHAVSALGFVALAAIVGLAITCRLRARAAAALAAVVLFDAALAWFVELPTTAGWNPLAAPPVAQFILNTDESDGRVLRDPAVVGAPSDTDLQRLSPQENYATFMRDVLDFNSARLWGLRTVDGFSPIEFGFMRAYRLSAAKPRGTGAPSVASLAEFCRTTGVRWLITTGPRLAALRDAGLAVELAGTWGPPDAFVLARLTAPNEAVCEERALQEGVANPAEPARVLDVHRFRPGYFRVDLEPGSAASLIVRETWADGWEAVDQGGHPLDIRATPEGLMQLALPAGVRQVRLRYVPGGWHTGLWLAALGLAACGGLVLAGFPRLRRRAGSPAAIFAASALLAVVVGVGARNQWSCTFDEGFHVTRGLMRLATGDSRLSYFHPPLQNLIAAIPAWLGYSEQLHLPLESPWVRADMWQQATSFAWLNRATFPDIVRAARWGSTFFLLIAIGAGAWWAHRLGGPLAGWLAGVGLALNPALLAHGNLVTTDMGLAACVLLGTALLWRAATASDAAPWPLWPATLAFVAAALVKHSGLLWLAGYALLAVPLLALARRSARPLWQIPLAVAVFALALLALYGPDPQRVRVAPDSWWYGRTIPAGRYVEGLISQGHHSLTGQRSFFHGERLLACPWWVNLAQLGLKNPPLWCMAALLGLGAWVVRCRRLSQLVPAVPALLFVALWLGANHLAIGVRHVLALVALGIVAAAVWAAGLPERRWRVAAGTALLAGSLAALGAYPDFISYYPQWAGGVTGGHRWMVDSNYDWGQDLERLEENWAALTDANGGVPPRLVYFGFVDPAAIYGIPASPPSLLGFMGRTLLREQGDRAESDWLFALGAAGGTTAASVSAVELNAFGADFSRLRAAEAVGRIGQSFRVYVPARAGTD